MCTLSHPSTFLLNLLIFSSGHATSVEALKGVEVCKAKNDEGLFKGLGSKER